MANGTKLKPLLLITYTELCPFICRLFDFKKYFKYFKQTDDPKCHSERV